MKKHAAKTNSPLTVAKNPLAEAVGSVKEFSGVRVETEQRSEKQPDNTKRMSHIEIAEVAQKRSDNVKRTIQRLVKEDTIASPEVEERPKQGVPGQFVNHLMLDRLDSITVMATVNSKYCAELVKRWDDLESGKAKPLCQVKKEQKKEPVSDDLNWDRVQAFKPGTISRLTEVFDEAMELGERLYEDRDQRVFYANGATEKLTGINCLALGDASIEGDTGSTYQPAPHMDRRYSAAGRQMTRKKGQYNLQSLYSLSELCNESGKSHSFIKNTLLSDGVMVRIDRYNNPKSVKYLLTPKGWNVGQMYDCTREKYYPEFENRILTSSAQPVFNQAVLDYFCHC